MCSECGGCLLVCQHSAIKASEKVVGEIAEGSAYGVDLVTGMLRVGEMESATVIDETKRYAAERSDGYEIVFADTPLEPTATWSCLS